MGDGDDDASIDDARRHDQERVATERREADVEARVEAADRRAAPRELVEHADDLDDLGEEPSAGAGRVALVPVDGRVELVDGLRVARREAEGPEIAFDEVATERVVAHAPVVAVKE